jgi:hypothetical protein
LFAALAWPGQCWLSWQFFILRLCTAANAASVILRSIISFPNSAKWVFHTRRGSLTPACSSAACYSFHIIGLGISFGSLLGWLGTAAGIIAVLGVSAVGIFPMNNLKPHVIAAMTYFRAGLAMVLFFGLAILFQHAGKPVFPPLSAILSLLAILAYGAFLTLPRIFKKEQRPESSLDPEQLPERPRVWALATLEWLVFFSTIAWLFGMTFFT